MIFSAAYQRGQERQERLFVLCILCINCSSKTWGHQLSFSEMIIIASAPYCCPLRCVPLISCRIMAFQSHPFKLSIFCLAVHLSESSHLRPKRAFHFPLLSLRLSLCPIIRICLHPVNTDLWNSFHHLTLNECISLCLLTSHSATHSPAFQYRRFILSFSFLPLVTHFPLNDLPKLGSPYSESLDNEFLQHLATCSVNAL